MPVTENLGPGANPTVELPLAILNSRAATESDGHRYQAAAERLAISVNTVRSYVRNVYDKLHVHSKSEAVSKALRCGLIV